MTLRSRYLLAALVTLRMALPAPAQQASLSAGAGQPASTNQQIASTIAEQLRQSRQLHGYTIDIVYQDGVAQLNGRVADSPQCEAALRIAQSVPGVERVQNNLILTSAIVQVQAPAPVAPAPMAPVPPRRMPEPPPANGGPMEPMPIFQAGFAGPADGGGPPAPPYAWPTYAPYNNYSRVAYPTAYPYNAWPFVGPCYPFPKIPLGWRSVKLEWEDGYWWFSKTATKFDWWRLRYW